MTDARPPHSTAGSWFLGAALLAVGGLGWWDLRAHVTVIAARTAELESAVARSERAIQLFRFERGSKGLGVTALLEHLRFWAPLLSLSTTPQREIPAIQERVDDIMRGLEGLGSDGFAPIEAAFRDAEPAEDDLRKWLLTAMVRLDPERGLAMLASCVRGFELGVSPRIRVHAAYLMLERDKPRLARVLGEVLEYESAAGIDPSRMGPDLRANFVATGHPAQRMPMFFNFIDIFVATGASDVEEKLIMVAGRPDHDLPTIQACVKQLGELRSARGVKVLKKLFERPPDVLVNPIFQNHCLEAIGKIEGAAACDYFKEALRRGADERVQAKLTELIKLHCR